MNLIHSLSFCDSNKIVVGAPNEVTGGGKTGEALIFKETSNNNWELFDRVAGGDSGAGDLFGFSVAIDESDSTVVVGARNAPVSGVQQAGAAYVYAIPGEYCRCLSHELHIYYKYLTTLSLTCYS